MLKSGSPVLMVAKHFNIGAQTVRDIKKRESELDRYEINFSCPRSDRKSLRLPTTEHVDEATYTWFKLQRADGLDVSGIMLRMKALDFNRLLGGPTTFGASTGWLTKFKIRHGINRQRTAGESGDADTDAALQFATTTIPKILEEEQITLSQLYNGDETGLIYRRTPTYTYALASEGKVQGKKQSKERVTILVGANATGDDKLPLIMIGKSKKPRCFNKINPSSLPLTYLSQAKAWMDSFLFKKIFTDIWVPYIKKSLRKRNLPQRAVILFDNATSHEQMEIDGIKTLFLPKNTTSLIQPMDQGPIAAMKKRYMSSFMQCAMDREPDVDIRTYIKKWNLYKTAFSLAAAWDQITEKTLKNAWKPILMITATVMTSDTPSLPESEDVAELPTPVDPEIQEWIDEEVPTSEDLTDEVIVQAILNPNPEPELVESDDGEDANVEEPPPTLRETIQEAESLLRKMMYRPNFTSSNSLYFASLIDSMKKEERDTKIKQTNLGSYFERI